MGVGKVSVGDVVEVSFSGSLGGSFVGEVSVVDRSRSFVKFKGCRSRFYFEDVKFRFVCVSEPLVTGALVVDCDGLLWVRDAPASDLSSSGSVPVWMRLDGSGEYACWDAVPSPVFEKRVSGVRASVLSGASGSDRQVRVRALGQLLDDLAVVAGPVDEALVAYYENVLR